MFGGLVAEKREERAERGDEKRKRKNEREGDGKKKENGDQDGR